MGSRGAVQGRRRFAGITLVLILLATPAIKDDLLHVLEPVFYS